MLENVLPSCHHHDVLPSATNHLGVASVTPGAGPLPANLVQTTERQSLHHLVGLDFDRLPSGNSVPLDQIGICPSSPPP